MGHLNHDLEPTYQGVQATHTRNLVQPFALPGQTLSSPKVASIRCLRIVPEVLGHRRYLVGPGLGQHGPPISEGFPTMNIVVRVSDMPYN